MLISLMILNKNSNLPKTTRLWSDKNIWYLEYVGANRDENPTIL